MIDVSLTARKIINNVETVIVGKRQQLILSLVSWFCEGHILLEDVPGVAKTMLARAGRQPGRFVQADPVYAGPAADRRHRHVDLQSEDGRV